MMTSLLELRRQFRVIRRALPSDHAMLYMVVFREQPDYIAGDGPTIHQAISDALNKIGWTTNLWVKLSQEKALKKKERRYYKPWEVRAQIPIILTGYVFDEEVRKGYCWARIDGRKEEYHSSSKLLAISKLKANDPFWLSEMKRIGV